MLNELKNVGLSDKEARVYLAMLELGPATVLEIAAKAGVNRPTAYVQIESLKRAGLTSTQTKGKKQLFIAESPSQLAQLLASEQKQIEQRRDSLKNVLPELTAMFNLGDEKPVVRYFEGKEGLLAMQEEFLKMKGKEILGLYDIDSVDKLFPNHPKTYRSRRVEKGIRSRSIYTSERGPILQESDAASLRESRFVFQEKMPFTADVTIFDENVAISSLRGKVGGTIITDTEVANSFRTLFELVWQSLEIKN